MSLAIFIIKSPNPNSIAMPWCISELCNNFRSIITEAEGPGGSISQLCYKQTGFVCKGGSQAGDIEVVCVIVAMLQIVAVRNHQSPFSAND